MKKIAIKDFFNSHRSFFLKTIFVCLCLLVTYVSAAVLKKNYEEKSLKDYPFEVMKHEAVLSYNQYKSELVKEVKVYIDSVAPASNLTGYAIVDYSEKYDLDIKFVLAQAQIESHFGTTGMALKTNSVFNVGAYDSASYDNINGKFKYKHPDYSIEPYMQLLYKDYITGTKTELDLMAKYVNKNGKRYSSNANYENDLFNLYKSIDKTTRITELQGEMRRYKIISGN
jgi:flagellum-specific peptidoglycan hydrolase FlgJ